jgi:hypothetical protein
MQYGTRGATIGLEEDEVNLCFSTPIAGLCTFCDFKAVMEDFMKTAVETNLKLDSMRLRQILVHIRASTHCLGSLVFHL